MSAETLAITGHVVPMEGAEPGRHFPGTVHLEGDRIVDVTAAGAPPPAGLAASTTVDVGDAWIYPGLIDLHSHIAYNALPLWHHEGEDHPYLHRNIWPGRSSYGPAVSWPAWILAHGAPESLMTYVQVRALAGGTTTIQGWPGFTRRPANQLVRNADDQTFDDEADPTLTSVLTLSPADLERRGQRLAHGQGFIYHCAEGQHESLVAREFDDAADAGCLRQNFIGIHLSAIGRDGFERWRNLARVVGDERPGSLVWSPFSNLWLYGETTRIPDARANDINVCLGTDWGPSGTKNLLGELKAARLAAADAGWALTDLDLVEMVTLNPGRALASLWKRPVGQLTAGGVADVAVLARRDDDPFASLVAAREEDVLLVVVDGRPRYGTKEHLARAGGRRASSVAIGRRRRRVVITDPTDGDKPEHERGKWFFSRVTANLGEVRRDPRATLEAPLASAELDPAAPAGPPSLQLSLDMPGGPGIEAGPPPPDVEVVIAPIPSLHHDRRWLRSLPGRGFHRGVLDGLADFYP